MRRIMMRACMVVAIGGALAGHPAWAEDPAPKAATAPPAAKSATPPLHEGAMEVTGQGTRTVATVVGGVVGTETVDGIDVGLYVLQAESVKRLAAGAKGPTHMFNVTLVDHPSGEMIHDATGTVTVTGAGGEQQALLKPVASHQRAVVRLDEEGEFQVRVSFATAGHHGTTRDFPFHYRRAASQGHRCGSGKCGSGK